MRASRRDPGRVARAWLRRRARARMQRRPGDVRLCRQRRMRSRIGLLLAAMCSPDRRCSRGWRSIGGNGGRRWNHGARGGRRAAGSRLQRNGRRLQRALQADVVCGATGLLVDDVGAKQMRGDAACRLHGHRQAGRVRPAGLSIDPHWILRGPRFTVRSADAIVPVRDPTRLQLEGQWHLRGHGPRLRSERDR